MIFVSVTRLRVRALHFLPAFAVYALRSLRQCQRASGFRGGSLLADRRLTFWTMTQWQDENAMRAFLASGTHVKAMPKLLNWCDEASVVHWEQYEANLPDWVEADRKMRAQGRPSKVRHPSNTHATLNFTKPRTEAAVPIRPDAKFSVDLGRKWVLILDMTNVLATLADPTRRSLVEMLRNGPLTVGELVARGSVSQSAVSQHLQVLKTAQLVEERREGARRYYRLDPAAIGELRAYVEALWNDALCAFNKENP